jgi:hypothetical protein
MAIKYGVRFSICANTAWCERLHLLAGDKRKRGKYIRDLIDLLYADKVVRDLVDRKMEVMREKS